MLLTNVKTPKPRLPLSEAEVRSAVASGSLTDVILQGVTPEGFHLEGVFHPEGGLPVPAVLVNRSGAVKTIKCPDRALQYVQNLGIEEFDVDVSGWDPSRAFDPARESFLSRRRRQFHEETLARIEQRLGEPYASVSEAASQQRLETLVRSLQAGAPDETDLRALTLCWCDVYLRRFPEPERARKALNRYARGSGIDVEDLDAQLDEYCTEEFKRRCKNQYLASLDLGAGE